VKALAEELVTLATDVETIAAGGSVDRAKDELAFDFDLRFRDQRSFVAGILQDGSRQGPPPAGFFTLPASAQSGAFSQGFDVTRWTGAKSRVSEIVDAFLEHDSVGRPARDRARRIIDTYFGLGGARSVANGPSPRAEAGSDVVGYTLQVIENPSKPVLDSLADMNALVGDRQVRKMLAKRLGIAEKSLPKASFAPLKGPGVPPGTRALVLKLPKEFYEGLLKSFASKLPGSSRLRGDEPPELVMAAVARGEGTAVVTAATPGDAALVLGDFLSGKAPTLRERPELLRFERMNALGGYFITLAGIMTSLAQSGGPAVPKDAGLPGHTPLFVRLEAQKGMARFGVTVPKEMLAEARVLLPALIR
jgi:hypothetical protein